MSLQTRHQRILKLISTLLISVGVGLAIFLGSQYVNSTAASASISSASIHSASDVSDRWIAYSVDYEMDKARGEKTIEHYGEGIRPIVEQAIENNEENPDSKPTAENSYQRESPLNDLLPDKIGQDFSEADLLEMQDTENPRD
ncbi:MAG: hypothetical protein WA783_16050 [Phormidesmis sp.]